MRPMRRWLAALWLAVLLMAAPAADGIPWFWGGNVVIPFRTIRGKIVATMSLDGKPGKNFVIDTGAFTTMFGSAAVSADRLKTTRSHGTIHCFGGDVPVTRYVSKATIFAGGLRITGGGVIWDMSPLQHFLAIPLTGIVGSDTITSRPILLDYQAGKITMFLGRHRPHFRRGAERIPLESPPPGAERFGGPVIAAGVKLPDGRVVSLNLEIDTGNNDGLILYTPFARKQGLLAAHPERSVIRYGCGGKYGLAPVTLPALYIGNQKIAHPQTFCAEKALGAAASTDVDGSIGYRILSRFKLFIDAPQHYVVFGPVAKRAPPTGSSAALHSP